MPIVTDEEYADLQLLRQENKRLQGDLVATYQETVEMVARQLDKRGYKVAASVVSRMIDPKQPELDLR